MPKNESPDRSSPVPLAIIANQMPPYRVHLHQRIARELPQVTLWSVCTHDIGGERWAPSLPEEIRPVLFGEGRLASSATEIRQIGHEWRKGGRIIQWMVDQNIQAVVMMGYADVGRQRIIHWCHRHGVPCFLFGDSNIKNDHATGVKAITKRVILGHVLARCSAIMPCGRLGEAYFKKYGASAEDIFLFPNEPDYDLIQSLPADFLDETRERFGMREGRRRFIFSGRFIAIKRTDLLVKAFIDIADRRPDWDLVMVGRGPTQDELLQLIPPELSDRIIWTGFLDDQAAVSGLYRLSDVLVLPSDFEAWALVVNEAVAAGLAVVTSEIVGAAAELVVDGVNGQKFPPGNLESLVQALLEVTRSDKIDDYKRHSSDVLAAWRAKADPVQGLRGALAHVKLL